MRYTIAVDQVFSLNHNLSTNAAFLLSIIHHAPSWAEMHGDGWFWMSFSTIQNELPWVFKSRDTVTRANRELKSKGLVEQKVEGSKNLFRLTSAGKQWGRKPDSDSSSAMPSGSKCATPSGSSSATQSVNNDHNYKDTPHTPPGGERSERQDSIPYDKIRSMFCDILPELPNPTLITNTRRKAIRARWNDHEAHQDLEFWSGLFTHIRESHFLMGRSPSMTGEPFRLTFDWLLRPTNFAKVIEGNYHGQ